MTVDDEHPEDRAWVARCVAHMVKPDPLLAPELALPIAEDKSARRRWRALLPEVAAQALFDRDKLPEVERSGVRGV